MIDSIKKELCTGCYACYNVCPENCIDMVCDKLGFRYPQVDYNKCKECKTCIQICPSLQKPQVNDKWKEPHVYAAWSLDEDIRFTSTSGGIFSELAKSVIGTGGYVAGAQYDEKFMVKHEIVDDIDGINKLKQSKYLQSTIGGVFKAVQDKILDNKKVAFCGSPCQVAGLLNFLKTPHENLITFDFVCRGTNSPKAYAKYLEMLEAKFQSSIKRVWFKNKTHGWNRFSTRIDLKNGKSYLQDRYHDLFMRGYIEENLYMRPCCFDCKYKEFPRMADITLADFWGVGNINSSLDPDKGTSLVMVNSSKGEKLFKSIQDSIFKENLPMSAALPGNACIVQSAVRNPRSEDFLLMLDEYPFDACFKKYAKNKGYKRIKNVISRAVNRF